MLNKEQDIKMSNKRSLVKYLILFFIFILIPFITNAYTIDTFDSYNLGDLNGQGLWTAPDTVNVENGTVVTGKAIESIDSDTDTATYTFSAGKDFTEITGYFQITGLYNTIQIAFYENTTELFNIYVVDHIAKITAGTNSDLLHPIVVSTWYKFTVELDNANNLVRAKIDENAFCDWRAMESNVTYTEITKIDVTINNYQTDLSYIDELFGDLASAEVEDIPSESIDLLASISVSDMNGMNLVYMIWMLGDIFIFLISFFIIIKT